MLYSTFARRGDPFALMRSMLGDVDSVRRASTSRNAFPAVNIWQGADTVTITCELPGLDPADIHMSVQEDVLMLSGERTGPAMDANATWHRRERGFGKFSRAIRLPFHAADDKVEARLVNGVLCVVIGRPEEEKPKKISINAA